MTIDSLIAVELQEISENFIAELWKSHKNHNEVFDLLPEYTLTADGQLCRAEEYLQFVGQETVSEPRMILFINIITIDHQLDYEFNEAGIVEMFKGIPFQSILKETGFKPDTEASLKYHGFLSTNYLICKLSYIASYDYYSGITECEVEFDIDGYLNENFFPVYLEKP